MTNTQTSLPSAYVIGNGDFTDIACEQCAIKFATDNNLTWYRGTDTYTEENENGAYASCIVFSVGESDSPYSCCGIYLETDFTTEGEANLRENFPAEVVALYFPAE